MNLVENPDYKIYFVPTKEKPIKLVSMEYPCPKNPKIRCKKSEMIVDGLVCKITCFDFKSCKYYE